MAISQRGYTLAELMVIVAIVGLLAAIALPALIRYTAVAKVGRAVAQAENDKLRVQENLLNDFAACGQITSTVTCNAASGALTSSADGATVVLTPTESGTQVTWACDITVAPSGISASDPCPND